MLPMYYAKARYKYLMLSQSNGDYEQAFGTAGYFSTCYMARMLQNS